MSENPFAPCRLCEEIDCPERSDCCTTVRWRICRADYTDPRFREWWLLHESARKYDEDGAWFIQWPMLCRNASPDGLRCLDYENHPDIRRGYFCRRMTDPADTHTPEAS